jgi:membrane fusion protein, copper/silver efflux system
MDMNSCLRQKGKGRRFSVKNATVAVGLLIITAVNLYLFLPTLCTRLHLSPGAATGKQGVAAGAVNYVCPMHSFIASDHPGACSICGMTLVSQQHAAPAKDVACSVHIPEGITTTPEQRVMANVAVTKVATREFSTETQVAGKVSWDERRLTRVSARISGRVERLHADFTGSRITSGEPLLDMYSPDLASAQREYLLALEGVEHTAEGSFSESRSMMTGLRDASRSRLALWGLTDRQISELERSRQPKKIVTINSPASGVIIERLVTVGQYVNEGAPLFSVGSLSTVWVIAELYESDLGRIEIGAPSLVATEAFPGKTFQGRVTFLEPVINSETRTLKVRIDLDNRGGLLKPEMFVKVRLKSRKLRALAVPEGAVIFSGDRSLVWLENGPSVFVPRNITVGRKGDGYYEVLSGLVGGESVAASGGFLLDGESQLKSGSSGEGKQP